MSEDTRMHRRTFQALKGIPLSIPKGFRGRFTDACLDAGFAPDFICVSSSRTIAKMWAEDRQTAAVLVAHDAFDEGEFCCRPIQGNELRTQRCFAVSRERILSSVAETFLKFCRASDLTESWEKYESEA